jgi:hypothetical protein
MLRQEADERKRQGQIKGGKTAGSGRAKNSFPPETAGTYSDNNHNDLPAANPPKEAEEWQHGEARYVAARALQIGKTQIQEAVAVKEAAPEEFERIKRGEIKVTTAYKKLIDAGKIRNGKPVHVAPPKPNPRRESYAKRRMIDVVSRIRGLCRGLSELNAAYAAAALSEEEVKTWINIAHETARQLRDFAGRLKEASK